MRENFPFFHTCIYTVLPRFFFFCRNFVKATRLLKFSHLNSWFDEIFFRWEKISNFSTVKIENRDHVTLSKEKYFMKWLKAAYRMIYKNQMISRNFCRKIMNLKCLAQNNVDVLCYLKTFLKKFCEISSSTKMHKAKSFFHEVISKFRGICAKNAWK